MPRKEKREFYEPSVEMRSLTKIFPARPEPLIAIKDLSLDIAESEIAVLLGPSGCGKSTLIRMIAGLDFPTSGYLSVKGHQVSSPVPECGMVFQGYTSFPWLTVLENIQFALRYVRTTNRGNIEENALHYAKLVGLEEFSHSLIRSLSGGMKQRVAIARALATEPDILLMDEPFGALDSQTRLMMQEHLLEIVAATKKTVVFVTHDIEEALMLGHRIYVISARPAHVIAEIDVPFPYPRTSETRNYREFFELKYEIFNLLREYVIQQELVKAHRLRLQRRNGS